MKGLRVPTLALAMCLLWIRPAGADPIMYTFTGTITDLRVNSSDPALTDINLWLPGLAVGMSYYGSLLYDTDLLPKSLSTGSAAYDMIAPNGFEVVVGAYILSATVVAPPGSAGTLTIINGPADLLAIVDFSPILTGSTPNPFLLDDLVMSLTDPTGTVLSDPTIPTVDLNRFRERILVFDGFGFSPTGGYAGITMMGTLDFKPVPEPSSLLLLGLGVTGMGKRLWKGTHRQPPRVPTTDHEV